MRTHEAKNSKLKPGDYFTKDDASRGVEISMKGIARYTGPLFPEKSKESPSKES